MRGKRSCLRAPGPGRLSGSRGGGLGLGMKRISVAAADSRSGVHECNIDPYWLSGGLPMASVAEGGTTSAASRGNDPIGCVAACSPMIFTAVEPSRPRYVSSG